MDFLQSTIQWELIVITETYTSLYGCVNETMQTCMFCIDKHYLVCVQGKIASLNNSIENWYKVMIRTKASCLTQPESKPSFVS